MANRIYVEATATPVPFPETRQRAVTGPAWVTDCAYWRRRIQDGSVRVVVPPPIAETPAPKPAKGKVK